MSLLTVGGGKRLLAWGAGRAGGLACGGMAGGLSSDWVKIRLGTVLAPRSGFGATTGLGFDL